MERNDKEMMSKSALRFMRKADYVLIVSCLACAAALGLFLTLQAGAGSAAGIYCDGVEICRIDLRDSYRNKEPQYYMICYEDIHEKSEALMISDLQAADARIHETADGQHIHIMHYDQFPSLPAAQQYNLISVADGAVTMEAADCRDQICVRHKPVADEGESIICLPHRLVIEISGETGSNALDGVAGL